MLDILSDLWRQYAERARVLLENPLPAAPLQDPIDETIRWQIHRDPIFAPKAPEGANLATLQLPELCSGEPTAPLVFVTINPSYDGQEVFPSIAHLEELGAETLEKWFEQRFAPELISRPLPHGRRPVRGKWPNPATCWIRVQGARDVSVIKGRTQRSTWGPLDWATRQCFGDALTQDLQAAPLGRAARLFDLVPWKFAHWGKVRPNRQSPEPRQPAARAHQLLDAGAEWLRRGIDNHEPRVIIACGTDVRRKMRQMDGEGSEVPEYQAGTPQSGWFRINTPRGQQRVRWFGVSHPATRPQAGCSLRPFDQGIQVIAASVRAALESS